MLYSWQLPFTLKQDDLWGWRLETLTDYTPTTVSPGRYQRLGEKGGLGLGKIASEFAAPFPSRYTSAVGPQDVPQPPRATLTGFKVSITFYVYSFFLAMTL